MKMKKLAALMLTTAGSAAFAQSGVTLYGLVDTNYRVEWNNTVKGSGTRQSLEDGAYTGPRWGVKGSEDLGGGLKAIFTLEAGFDLGTGAAAQASGSAGNGEEAAPSGRAFGRESWVGLSDSRWGTVQFGRYYTLAHLVSSRFQAMGNPNMNSISVFSGHQRARQDNMVTYTGRLGPVTLGAQKTLGEQQNNPSGNASWSVSAAYDQGLLYLGAYASDINTLTANDTRHIRGGGGSYKVASSTQLYAGYMKRTQDVSKQENKVWTAAINQNLTPALVLTVSYISDKQSGTTALTGERKVGFVGLDYYLSKRTDLYAIVDHNKVAGGYSVPANMPAIGNQTGLSLGVRHRF